MIGKKVKVFWPVDESWYIGLVVEFDAGSGEHELQYPDGDREWVKIGDIISAAAAGNGGGGAVSANNSTIATNETSSLGGGMPPHGHHDPLTPQHDPMVPPPRHLPQQLPPPLQHSPTRREPLHHQQQHDQPPPSHPQLHHPPSAYHPSQHPQMSHHEQPPPRRVPHQVEQDVSPDYRPGNSVSTVPPSHYYGGSYPSAGLGQHYPPPPGPGPPTTSNVTSGIHPPPNPQQVTSSGPPPALSHHHHSNMGPPSMIPPYGMYPYGGAPMYPSHMGGPPPYGMPTMGSMGVVPPYYSSVGRNASPPPVRGPTEHVSSRNSTSNRKDDADDDELGGGRSKKSGPKPWTKEEDTLLLSLVHTMQWPMKWTVVAQSLPERTGKQCRERYVNHLNPRLKASDWNPVEDSTIFHLYNTIGSHWAKMSKIIPGRTDNGIKNRFHNIRRQYEREDQHRLRLSSVEDFPDEVRLDRLRKFPEHLEGKSTTLWDMKSAIGVLAAQSVLGGPGNGRHESSSGSGVGTTLPRFGPFRKPKDDSIELCVRCGLLVPSVHTGDEICVKTGWCQTCTRIPPNVSANLLRECLNLRRSDTKELRDIIESFEEYFRPTAKNEWPYKKSNTSKLDSVDKKYNADTNLDQDEKYADDDEDGE